MAPTFRSSRSGRQFIDNSANRTRSGVVDHDVFEGLPVRRWSRQTYTFSQDPKLEVPEPTNRAVSANQPFPELPMPKDSNLLPPMSKALLRAARAGCIYIRHINKEAEGEVKEVPENEEPAPAGKVERSFTARKWSVVPKHVEPPEVEYLAKRRPGLRSLYGASGALTATNTTSAPPMRKTKVKKVDPVTGKASIYEAWVAEGATLDGEVNEESLAVSTQREATATKETPAEGTIVKGVGVLNAEGVLAASGDSSDKPRPSTPKRKGNRAGRGRKKRVMFAPGEGADAATVHGIDGAADDTNEEFEDDEDDEDDEERGPNGEESTREETTSVVEAKYPGVAVQDFGATPTTEQDATPIFEPAGNKSPSTEPQPLATSQSPEKPILELSQAAPQVLPDTPSSDASVPSVQETKRSSSPEKPQPAQALEPSKTPSPAIRSSPAKLEPSPVIVETTTVSVKDEVLEDAPGNVQTLHEAEVSIEPTPLPETDAMEGVEQTTTVEQGLSTLEQAPTVEKAEVIKAVEQTEMVDKPETVEEKEAPIEIKTEALVPAAAAVIATEAIPAPAVSDSPAEQAPVTASEGGVDLLGTFEASLGEGKEKNHLEQEAIIAPAFVEQDRQLIDVQAAYESGSAPTASPAPTPPAPAPVIEETKPEPTKASDWQQPSSGSQPETKESEAVEEKTEEPAEAPPTV